jgi:hypothetical protein
MIRKIALTLMVTALFGTATLYASSSSDLAFLKALTAPGKNKKKKKNKKAKAAPGKKAAAKEYLWLKLESHQMRAVRLKQKAQTRLMRRDSERDFQRFPIELSSNQKLAIRKLLKIRKPMPRKVFLWIDFKSLKKDAERSRASLFVVRKPEQFNQSNPSDRKPE